MRSGLERRSSPLLSLPSSFFPLSRPVPRLDSLFTGWFHPENDLKCVLKYDNGVFRSELTSLKLVFLTQELARSNLLAAAEELATGSKLPSYLLQLKSEHSENFAFIRLSIVTSAL